MNVATASEDCRPASPGPGSLRSRAAKRSVFAAWQVRSERGGQAS
jgi:hypothetical protein